MANMLTALVGIAIGLIVLVAVFSLAPLIGDKIATAADVTAGSDWDATNMSAAGADGVTLWTDNASLIALAVLVLILSIVIGVIMTMGRGGE